MPHIHTEPGQHDTTASALIIRIDESEPRVLLHVHKKAPVILQVGGHVELDETPWQAILHEINEETGYDLSQLMILQPFERIKTLSSDVLHPMPVVTVTHQVAHGAEHEHYHTDSIYVFVAKAAPVGKPAEAESQDLRWYSQTDLTSERGKEILADVKVYCQFVFNECLPNWEQLALSDFKA